MANRKRKRGEPRILRLLEEAFERERVKVPPKYPYDKKTDTIRLPEVVEAELRGLVLAGNRVEAIKRVAQLTGAGLRVSKDYVDRLGRKRK